MTEEVEVLVEVKPVKWYETGPIPQGEPMQRKLKGWSTMIYVNGMADRLAIGGLLTGDDQTFWPTPEEALADYQSRPVKYPGSEDPAQRYVRE